MRERITERPGKGSPTAFRTVLRIPSAPTTYAARSDSVPPPGPRTSTVTHSASCVSPVTSVS